MSLLLLTFTCHTGSPTRFQFFSLGWIFCKSVLKSILYLISLEIILPFKMLLVLSKLSSRSLSTFFDILENLGKIQKQKCNWKVWCKCQTVDWMKITWMFKTFESKGPFTDGILLLKQIKYTYDEMRRWLMQTPILTFVLILLCRFVSKCDLGASADCLYFCRKGLSVALMSGVCYVQVQTVLQFS